MGKRIFLWVQTYNLYVKKKLGGKMNNGPQRQFKKWEDLDITDDFIFSRVMRNKKRIFFHFQVYNIYKQTFTEIPWKTKPPPKTANTKIPSL